MKEHIKKKRRGFVFSVEDVYATDTQLFCEVFGDSAEDIKSALRSFSSTGFCVSLKAQGQTLSQFIAIRTNLCLGCGIYIYALCTSPLHRKRGYMREIIYMAKKHFRRCGYKFFLLLPANERLFSTYERMGFSTRAIAHATPEINGGSDLLCDFDTTGLALQKRSADIAELYEMSEKTFSFEVFAFSVSYALENAQVMLFSDEKGQNGFFIGNGQNAFLCSQNHKSRLKVRREYNALIMPLGLRRIKGDAIFCEPMPR